MLLALWLVVLVYLTYTAILSKQMIILIIYQEKVIVYFKN